jgi:integrase
LYCWTLGKHITPYLGRVPLGNLTTPLIREWRARLLTDGVSPGMTAKAYRLLRAILWTAVKEDEVLTKNPCRIPGADKETPGERPHLTLRQVGQLMDTVPNRYRLMILVAALASLRFGEITALELQDVDLDAATVRVRQQFVDVKGRGLVLGPPKSRAGKRTVTVPAALVPMLAAHIAEYVGPEPSALIFTTSTGRPIRRGTFNNIVGWRKAVASVGVPDLHFHDLRHTGNMLAADSMVSTRDLMARMGHDSMTAALIYQHATRRADQRIADHLGARLAELTDPDDEDDPDEDGDDGAAGVLARTG